MTKTIVTTAPGKTDIVSNINSEILVRELTKLNEFSKTECVKHMNFQDSPVTKSKWDTLVMSGFETAWECHRLGDAFAKGHDVGEELDKKKEDFRSWICDVYRALGEVNGFKVKMPSIHLEDGDKLRDALVTKYVGFVWKDKNVTTGEAMAEREKEANELRAEKRRGVTDERLEEIEVRLEEIKTEKKILKATPGEVTTEDVKVKKNQWFTNVCWELNSLIHDRLSKSWEELKREEDEANQAKKKNRADAQRAKRQAEKAESNK